MSFEAFTNRRCGVVGVVGMDRVRVSGIRIADPSSNLHFFTESHQSRKAPSDPQCLSQGKSSFRFAGKKGKQKK